jgi:DNA-binding CsgD family transcriptional regulator
MSDLPAGAQRRQEPLRAAERSLGSERTRAAEKRGQDMTLATAAELAVMLTGMDPGARLAQPDLGRLSVKEQELVVLVAQGHTDAEIAEQLGLTVGIVRSRMSRLRAKAGCARRADLTRLALQAGLV